MCGLINRYVFSCPDLGFALLPDARKQGIALEATKAVIDWVEMEGDMHFITASTHPENERSQHLLRQLGFKKNAALTLLIGPHRFKPYSGATVIPLAVRTVEAQSPF